MSKDNHSGSKGGKDVGYKKPPKHSQFKPGHSGNPGGRPKKEKPKIYNADELCQKFIMTGNQRIQVTKNGKTVDITVIEGVFERLHQKALQGDPWAIKQVMGMQFQQFEKRDQRYAEMAGLHEALKEELSKKYEKYKKGSQSADFEGCSEIMWLLEELRHRVRKGLEDD